MQWNLDLVKSTAAQFGYVVLSEDFKSSKEKIKLGCPLGHEYEVKWAAFHCQRQRCRQCG